MIDYTIVSLAFFAGIGIFFSPCGVALLPAYVSFLLGRKRDETSIIRRGIDGLVVGAFVSAGIVTVFLGLGAVISLLGNFLAPYAFWFGAGTGIALIILGVFMFVGRTLRVTIPRPKGGTNKDAFTFYIFGVGYALGGIACTLPAFLLVVFTSLGGGSVLGNIANFIAFTSGTVLLMLIVTTATAISQGFVERVIIARMGLIYRFSAIVIIIAGAYLIYFNTRAFIF